MPWRFEKAAGKTGSFARENLSWKARPSFGRDKPTLPTQAVEPFPTSNVGQPFQQCSQRSARMA